MANYAHIDPITNQVINIIVADAKYIDELSNKNEWVEYTSDKKNVGVGATYYKECDCFISPKPLPSWKYDLEEEFWKPPLPCPEEGLHEWDEDNLRWKEITVDIKTLVGIASTSNAQEIDNII